MTIKVQLGVTADELELLLASVKGAEQFDVTLRGDREREPRLWAMRLRLESDLHKLREAVRLESHMQQDTLESRPAHLREPVQPAAVPNEEVPATASGSA
jgi:hypothetical protein